MRSAVLSFVRSPRPSSTKKHSDDLIVIKANRDGNSDWSGGSDDDDSLLSDASDGDCDWSGGSDDERSLLSDASDGDSEDSEDAKALVDQNYERQNASGQSCNFCDHPASHIYVPTGNDVCVCICNGSDCQDEFHSNVDEQFAGKMSY